jgi:hypothetical protein
MLTSLAIPTSGWLALATALPLKSLPGQETNCQGKKSDRADKASQTLLALGKQ